jgi:hypothetical protein
MLHKHVEIAEVPLERVAQTDRGGADRIVRQANGFSAGLRSERCGKLQANFRLER